MGDRRFRELIEAGVIERKPPGDYELDRVRESYILHIRKMAAGRGGADLASERANLAREQAAAAAMRNAAARGELVAVEEIGRQVEAAYAVVRERLLSIPGKLSAALEGMSAGEREGAVAAEITEALNELHKPAFASGADRPEPASEPNCTGAPSPQTTAAPDFD